MLLSLMRPLLFAFLILVPIGATAQSPAPQPAAPSQQVLKPEELDALVAPIALYPDTLLSLVFMAATYPLEVVQAERWATQNATLKGDQLKAAADKQPWDESVRSLVATPSVLTMMSTKLDWTQKLGDAVLAQETDVMDAVQRLRAKAQANQQLQSTKQQTVTVSQVQQRQVISIAPTEPNTVYVPYYNPAVVYGGWPYPSYPPYYFPPPGYIAGGVIATGLAFGAGYALGRWASGGNYWGGGVNWSSNNLTVNRPVNINNSGNSFQHRPEHRHGVRYNNPGVQQKFGSTRPGGSQGSNDFRGHSGKQGSQPKAGQQPAGGKGQQPKAGQQPGGGKGQQAKAGQGQQGKAGQGQQGKGGGKGQQAKGGQGPSAGGGAGPKRDAAFGNTQSGKSANLHSQRGQSSFAQGGGGRGGGGGGGAAAARGGGGGGAAARGGGGGGRGGGGGGGRRSDVELKQDIALLGYLDNGLGFYRFAYRGSETVYVGVMAQEVQVVMPDAVVRGRDGYLRVFYDRLGLTFQTYDRWIASGAQVPPVARRH